MKFWTGEIPANDFWERSFHVFYAGNSPAGEKDDYLNFLLTGTDSENVVVACGVSGGQDSDALAIEVNRFLKTIDFPGEFVLIHSDLGLIEHRESLPQ